MQSGNAAAEFDSGRVVVAGALPLAVGLIASMAGTGPGPSLHDLGSLTLMALVFALAEVASQTVLTDGSACHSYSPEPVQDCGGRCLFFGLAASGAIGP